MPWAGPGRAGIFENLTGLASPDRENWKKNDRMGRASAHQMNFLWAEHRAEAYHRRHPRQSVPVFKLGGGAKASPGKV